MKALLRRLLTTLLGSVAFLASSAAMADGEACYNDIDCPGAECGGAVCNWSKSAAMPMGDKTFACNPAGSQTPTGSDGWCTTTDDCKCKGLGAICVQPYCTFTKPSEAPAGGGTGAGGTASTAGAGTAAGGTASTPPAAEEGGCSVASPASTGSSVALALGLIGLGAAFARRRR
jgi:MYXO-CTERM domain-containing protein